MARPREFDVDKAIESAMLLFWKNGYRGTSLSDIQRALDTLPNLSVLDQPGPAPEVLQELFGRLAACYTGSSTPQGCLVVAMSLEYGTAQDALGRAISDSIAHGENKLRETLVRAQKDGSLPRATDIKAVARFLVASSLARRGSRKEVEDVGRRVLSSLR